MMRFFSILLCLLFTTLSCTSTSGWRFDEAAFDQRFKLAFPNHRAPASSKPKQVAPLPQEEIVNHIETKVEQKPAQKGETKKYVVQENDTLMLIAFKLYGHYKYWKDLIQVNLSKFESGEAYTIDAGLSLAYYPSIGQPISTISGSPYIIRKGDTLQSISKDHYGTTRKWQKLWKNNQYIIYNPDLIYTGISIGLL